MPTGCFAQVATKHPASFHQSPIPMRKFAKKLHLWLALPFGLIITITCLTGSLLTFEKELTELVYRERYVVHPTRPTPLSLTVLSEQAAQTLPDSVQITGITVPSDSTRAYTVHLSKPRKAGLLIDPYTGQVLGRSDRGPFFTTVFRLHRWLLDSMNPQREGIFWGRVIVGTSTLLFVFILITGLLAWLPKKLRGLGKRLTIHTRHGMPRFLHELHTVGGIYLLTILLVIALTGLTWSFEWYAKGFYGLFGVEQKDKGKEQGKKGDKHGDKKRNDEKKDVPAEALPASYIHWQAVYEQIHADKAHHPKITLHDGKAEGSLSDLGNARAADIYHYDRASGAITRVERYADAPASAGARGWVYAVHTGAWGGWLTKLLWCLTALFGSTLPLTGYYLLYRRLRKRHQKA